MAHNPNVANNENYCKVKQELASDVDDQLMPTAAVLWLTRGAQQQLYKEELYASHVVKEELVIGPEVLQPLCSATDSDVTSEGASCVRISQSDVQDVVQLDKAIKDHKIVESECSKALGVAIMKAESEENVQVDLKENELIEINNLSSNVVQDSHMVDSLNSLEDNSKDKTINCGLHFSCSKCKNPILTSETLKKNLRLNNTSRQFVCDLCGHRFIKKQYLIKHINRRHLTRLKVHSKAKQYVCSHCQHKFKYNSKLKQHLRIHTGEKPYSCSYCEYSCSRNCDLKRHLRTHTGEKPFSYTYCKYSCNGSGRLKAHLRTHTGEKPYNCMYCKYSCNTSAGLNAHLRTHTGEKPFSCTYCKYSCSASSDLKKHLRTHTGEKPFSCPYCEYSCNGSGRLKVHLRIHTGEKPYNCTYCKYSCNISGRLKAHLRTHTGEKPYSCTYCKYSCSASSYLKAHLRTHTGEKPYSCT